jgi:hypothetical protein
MLLVLVGKTTWFIAKLRVIFVVLNALTTYCTPGKITNVSREGPSKTTRLGSHEVLTVLDLKP